MNFIAQVEEHLRDLGSEARKKHPGVKEASERAILQLRTLQNAYVTAVRKATHTGGPHPTTALFRSQDLLRPFLLAANYPNASPKLLQISLSAMSLLMEGNAICPGDGIHMVRVWTIQAHVCASAFKKSSSSSSHASSSKKTATSRSSLSSTTEAHAPSSSWFGMLTSSSSSTANDVSSSSGQGSNTPKKESERVALELLSCLIQLLELRELPVTEEQWTASVTLCVLLWNVDKSTVKQAAISTLYQVLGLLFETATLSLPSTSPPTATAKHAVHTWQDLLTLSSLSFANSSLPSMSDESLHGAFSHCTTNTLHGAPKSGPAPPSPTVCLELMHRILKQQPKWFWNNPLTPTTCSWTQSLWMQTEPSASSLEVLWRSSQLACDLLTTGQSQPQQTIQEGDEKCQQTTQEESGKCEGTTQEDGKCRQELLSTLVQAIVSATEVCRNHHDFEDGYVYDELESRKVSQHKSSSALIPDSSLWKAGLALETLYLVLSSSFSSESLQTPWDIKLLATVTEALSDFATIGASCRDHMLQLVERSTTVLEDEKQASSLLLPRIQPTFFHKAEGVVKPLASSSSEFSKGGGANASLYEKLHSSEMMGDALWIAFHCLLLLTHTLSTSPPSDVLLLLEGSFAPSLAVFQHFLKRFPGSSVIVQCTLVGYRHLAKVTVPLSGSSALQRKAVVASLCKLSLPSWGKLDATCQMQDNHVETLVCLLDIIHNHHDSILSEWHMVLWTWEELSTVSIASPRLSATGYASALAVAATYARIAPFSTCLSSESLIYMINALAEISMMSLMDKQRDGFVDGGDNLVQSRTEDSMDNRQQDRRMTSNSIAKSTLQDEGTAKESLGGKLMSFAGRALLGTPASEATDDDTSSAPLQRNKKNTYYSDYRQDFLRRLTSSKRTLRNDVVGKLPFSLIALTDVALSNLYRYNICGSSISKHLCSLAAKTSPEIRAYAMDTLAMVVTSQLSEESSIPSSFSGPGRLVVTQHPDKDQYLVVEGITTEPTVAESIGEESNEVSTVSQVNLLSPLCETIRSTSRDDVAEAGISALHSILEGAGHNLTGDVWTVLIEAVASLSGEASTTDVVSVDRSGSEWSTCSMLAFRCLKLVVDDFLDQLPPPSDSPLAARTALLDCCSSFGSSRHDVNTSLTAIGLLWSIADQDANSWSIDRALSKLVILSSDDRTEVRNCSVNTLFSCIVGRGHGFSSSQWEVCICETIFGVYDRVLSRGGESSPPTQRSSGMSSHPARYQVSIHHSRDSVGKQWATTEVMVLRGLNRVLRNFFDRLLDTTYESGDSDFPWFETAWQRILDLASNAATQSGSRETLDLRIAGIDLLVLCNQLSCRAGMQAAITPARVGTNMEVVNGALRSVRDANAKNQAIAVRQRSASEDGDRWRVRLFISAFDALDAFRNHLDEGADNDEETKSIHMETVQVQVLHKLSLGLTKLYECCKDDEFSPQRSGNIQRRPSRLHRYLGLDSERNLYKSDLECRFVDLVVTVARKAVSDPNARFLTQAQRAAFDLLRLMTSQSSNEAFRVLASLGGQSFFWIVRKDGEDEVDDDERDGNHPGSEILGREAAKAVADEAKSNLLSDETKVQVLCRILSVFLAESDNDSWRVEADQKHDHQRRRCYKLLVPVMDAGLTSASRLEKFSASFVRHASESDDSVDDSIDEGFDELLSYLWEKIAAVIALMLSPVHGPHHTPYISRTNDILELLATIIPQVPQRHHVDFCALLSSGVTKSMEVAVLHSTHDANDVKDEKGDSKRTTKKYGDDALLVFKSCFDGICKLQPRSPTLRALSEHTLDDAITSMDALGVAEQSHIHVQAAIIVCRAMQARDDMESLVIAVFPLLCKLVSVEHATLRKEVGKTMGSVDVGRVLNEATTKCEAAEEQARIAEEQNQELMEIIEDLREENELLQQQIAVYSASSALT